MSVGCMNLRGHTLKGLEHMDSCTINSCASGRLLVMPKRGLAQLALAQLAAYKY